ncbi:ribulokinase [Schaalia sp. lx-260]|uniref:ribulokinase n=1 Tax=Schaalia sp. lx-260 TaxID=2899082 RepID=UPI001E42E52E|nr:ribulokinase [Schaalia sp. lx-260]MCD4548942.1 ribulokinase [Schaalia sp. lx-260]
MSTWKCSYEHLGVIMRRLALGIDFGTESARTLLVDLDTGTEITTAISLYPHAVMDRTLWRTGTPLPAQWALQDADDWLISLKESVTQAIKTAQSLGYHPHEITSIGIDTTACTVVLTDTDLNPLSRYPDLHKNPYAYARLWKDHASQSYAEKINRITAEIPEFLEFYGGALSPEWMLPKALFLMCEAPEIFTQAQRLIEQSDWIVSQLIGHEVRGKHTAGYKSCYRTEKHSYPSPETLEAIHPGFSNVLDKLGQEFLEPGEQAGTLTPTWAQKLGLPAHLPVAIGNMDAHVALLGSGCTEPGTLVAVMGTSVCNLIMAKQREAVKGIQGVVYNGIIPGYWAYEAGQAGVGDTFGWFVQTLQATHSNENKTNIADTFRTLEKEASAITPASTGIISLDWLNGNRSVLINSDLSGAFIGLTLRSTRADIYRSLLEGVAFGQRVILESFESCGIPVNRIITCGGLPHKSPLLMQIMADVTGREIEVTQSSNTPALGAALHGALAAGTISDWKSAAELVKRNNTSYTPQPQAHEAYSDLYTLYLRIHDWFGIENPDLMKELRTMHQKAQLHDYQ